MDFILHSTLTSALERLKKHYRYQMRDAGANRSIFTRELGSQGAFVISTDFYRSVKVKILPLEDVNTCRVMISTFIGYPIDAWMLVSSFFLLIPVMAVPSDSDYLGMMCSLLTLGIPVIWYLPHHFAKGLKQEIIEVITNVTGVSSSRV